MTFKERVCKLFWQKENNLLFLPLFVALEEEATLSLEEVYVDPGPRDCALPEGRAVGLAPRSSLCPRSWVQIDSTQIGQGGRRRKHHLWKGFLDNLQLYDRSSLTFSTRVKPPLLWGEATWHPSKPLIQCVIPELTLPL